MPVFPPISPADPAVPPCPAESPCESPEDPSRAAPEFAPPPPDTCVPDQAPLEDPVPDDAPGSPAPDEEPESRAYD